MKLQAFRDASRGLKRYETGETVKEISARTGMRESDVLKLNANENLFLPLKFLQGVLREVIEETDPRLYPSEDRAKLQEALGKYLGVFPEQVVLGAGGDQLIELVLHAFLRKGEEMLAVTPTFSMYGYTAETMGAEYRTVDIEEDFSLDAGKVLKVATSKTDILILCNPNNPTANQFEHEKVHRLTREFQGLVLADEAYADYADYSLIGDTSRFDNLLILRTFSKAFGLAGLRLGYVITNMEVARVLNERYQMPYPISSVALKMGLKLLERREHIKNAVEAAKKEREWLIESLNRIKGVRAFHSDTNFVLFSLPLNYHEVYDELLNRGIIIRKIGSIPGARNCLRVSVAPKDKLKKFLDALRKVLQ